MSDTESTTTAGGLSQEEVDERFAWLFSTFEMETIAEMMVDGLFYPLYSDDIDVDRKIIEFRVDESGPDGGEISMLDITDHVDELEMQADHAAGTPDG